MQLSLMDLKLLKIGYMKKLVNFFKIIIKIKGQNTTSWPFLRFCLYERDLEKYSRLRTLL